MMATDRTALICDLAETYGVLNYRELPVETLAALSAGLRENSRIKMKLAGIKVESDIMLLAAAVDRLTWIAWTKTKDAEKGLNRPKSWHRLQEKKRKAISWHSTRLKNLRRSEKKS